MGGNNEREKGNPHSGGESDPHRKGAGRIYAGAVRGACVAGAQERIRY